VRHRRGGAAGDDSAGGGGASTGTPGKVARTDGIARRESGSGGGLPGPIRGELETALDADLGSVRLHTGDDAADVASSFDARALAVGDDIYFGDGQYDPSGSAGRHLIAHEVAHTVQGRGAAPMASASSLVTSPADGAEREAEHFAADFAARGGAARTTLRESLGSGVVARVGMEGYVEAPVAPSRPDEPDGVTAAAWMTRFGETTAVLVEAHLAQAVYAPGHARLRWIDGPESFAVLLWREITSSAPDLYRQLVRLLAPTDVAALIDQHRRLGDRARSDGQAVGPLDWTPTVALAIAGEVDRRALSSLGRVAPRVVAAMDCVAATTSDGQDSSGPHETSLVAAAEVTASHPMDAAVARTLCAIAVAEVLPAPTLAEPAAAPATPLRPVRYRWHDDPQLWNWIQLVEPLDATVEEVALSVLGAPDAAFLLRGAAPFFQLPPDEAARRAPERARGAIASAAGEADGPFAAARAMAMTGQGARPDGLASGNSGEQAGLAQAGPPAADVDVGALAARCQLQLVVLTERYPELGVGPIVAAALTRLVTRELRLTAAPEEERARLGAVFAAQTEILGEIIGRLDALRRQVDSQRRAARRDLESAWVRARITAETDGGSPPPKPELADAIDPALLAHARELATAAATSDLPDLARQRLADADAREQDVLVDSLDAMLDDGRRRMAAAQPQVAAHGPDDVVGRRSSVDVAAAVGARHDGLADEVLAARRAQAAGTMADDDVRRLHERVRAAHVEARLVSNIAQLGAMADQLDAMQGVRQTVAQNGDDLARARVRLRRLRNDMHGVFTRWQAANQALDATADARATTSDDGEAARGTVAALEAELKTLGDAEVQQALQLAVDELEDAVWINLGFDVAAMIGIGLVSGQLVGAAGAVVRGWRLGRAGMAAVELSRGAQLAGRGVGLVAEASLNAGAQAGLQGGGLGEAFADNLLGDAATLAMLGPLRRAFDVWGAADAASMTLWKKVGRGGALALRTGVEISATTLVGAASSYVAHRLAASGPVSDQTALDWAVQGASIAVGKFVHARLQGFQHDLDAIAEAIGRDAADGLRRRASGALARADELQSTGDNEQALLLLADHRRLLDDELALLRAVADDPDALAARGLQRSTVLGRAASVEAQADATTAAAFPDLPLRLAGLEPIADGVWTGGDDQIEPALTRARAAGAGIEIVSHDRESGRWHVRIAGRDAEIIARPVYAVPAADGTVARVQAQHEPPIVSAAAIASQPNRLVGRPLPSVAAGEDLLRRLNRGDLAALADIGAEAPAAVPHGMEWGLGATPEGRTVLVRGEEDAVDWARLPGIIPLAHSHPPRAGGHLPPDATGARRMPLAELSRATSVPLLNRAIIMPSGADIAVMSTRGVPDHLVVTPFVVGHDAEANGRWISEPGPDAGPARLEFRIKGARRYGTDAQTGAPVYHAVLEPRWAGDDLASFEVWAVVANAGDDPGVIHHAPRSTFVRESGAGTEHRPVPSRDGGLTQDAPRSDEAASERTPAFVPAVDLGTSQLSADRMHALSQAGLSRRQLESLANDFSAADLSVLDSVMSPGTLAAFYASSHVNVVGLRVILASAANQRILGVKDWVSFEASRGDTSGWANSLGELREALRLVIDDPAETVTVGQDARAPTRTGRFSPRGTPEKAPSFDLSTANQQRSIEVTSVASPVVAAGDLSDAIAHATAKVHARSTEPVDAPSHASGAPLPIAGTKEVVIRINLFHGVQVLDTGTMTVGGSRRGELPESSAGLSSVAFDGTGKYRFQHFAAARPVNAGGPSYTPTTFRGDPNPGSIIDNTLTMLNRQQFAKAHLLDRIRLVSADHSPVAEFVRDPGSNTWSIQ
jgi:hypothetical protein